MFYIDTVALQYENQPMAFTRMPPLNWILKSDKREVTQEAFQIQVAADRSFSVPLCDTGRVPDHRSAQVDAPALELKSASRYYIRVKAWNNYGEESDWSAPVSFISGIIDNREWKAAFITAETAADKDLARGTYIRKPVRVQKEIKEAYAYTTALGLYHFYINGRKVGEDQLTPGWTSYENRLLYQTYDIKDYLNADENVLAAHLGAGWYKGTMGFTRHRNLYGDRTAFLCQLLIRYSDGSEEIITSDESWKGCYSPVLFSEIYDGEEYDARLEQDGWNQPGFDDRTWNSVSIIEKDKNITTVQEGCTVREIETVPPRRIFKTPAGDTVIDFGQNMTGWVEFTAAGQKDALIQFHYFETLDKDGNVYRDNLRTAKSMLTYTCRDEKQISYKPAFCFHGFQYIKVDAFPGEVSLDNFKAYVVHSNMEPAGSFSCSNPDLNQLQHNIRWGLKGNFLDIPTDCPQRDERLGWTGDAQIFSSTATYLMNTYTFFSKWLADLAADQSADGGVPHVIPDILSGHAGEDKLMSQGQYGAAAWADAAVINPWTLYLKYGDTKIIEQQYDSMKRWIDFMKAHSDEDGSWSFRLQFGDWVALDAEEGSYLGATPEALICAAYYAYSTRLFALMAKAIGKAADYESYYALYQETKTAFGKRWFKEDGTMNAQTQTAHIVALYFDLVPEAYREICTEELTRLLAAENGHLVTGFVGTPYFCHALSQNGRLTEAYELLLKDDFPSWLYQVRKGATTIWEHWDGLKDDGSMWSADMNSFNHYAYGAIGDWMYRVIAGIEADENQPGYKHSIIQPHTGGGLTWADGSYESVYGTIATHWETNGDQITLQVEIPVNTTASVILDQADQIISADGLTFCHSDKGLRADAGSGSYVITYKMK